MSGDDGFRNFVLAVFIILGVIIAAAITLGYISVNAGK